MSGDRIDMRKNAHSPLSNNRDYPPTIRKLPAATRQMTSTGDHDMLLAGVNKRHRTIDATKDLYKVQKFLHPPAYNALNMMAGVQQ